MKKVLFTFLYFAIGSYVSVYAQDVSEKKLFKEALASYNNEHYRISGKAFDKLIEIDPTNAKYYFYDGISELMSFSYELGLKHIHKAYELDPKVDKYIYYWLGRAEHLNYNFKEAIEYFNLYKELLGKKDSRRQDADKMILECEYGYDLVNRPTPYRVKNTGETMNTKYSEHSPVVSQDGKMIIYTSRKYHDEADEISFDGDYHEKVFVTYRNENGTWSEPKPLFDFELEDDKHHATVELFENDTKLLLYRNDQQGDIYVSERNSDTSWSEPEKLKNINTVHREADAYVSYDGQEMYVSSARENLEGDLDIFVCQKQEDGHWSSPVNLGKQINTNFNENSPFVSRNKQTMYFSSEGHTSMGGYDVFRVDFDSVKKSWGVPQNVGYPINTPGDDIYFYYSDKNAWSGYFSSYRSGGYGEKDIYEVTFIPNVTINGLVLNEDTEEPLTNIDVSFVPITHEDDGIQYHYKNITNTNTNDPDGKFDVRILASHHYNIVLKSGLDTLLVQKYEVQDVAENDPTHFNHTIRVKLSSDNIDETIAVKDEIEEVKDPIIKDEIVVINDPIEKEEIIEEDVDLVEETVDIEPTEEIVNVSEKIEVVETSEYIETVENIEATEEKIEKIETVENIESVEEVKDTIKFFNLREEDIKEGCRVILRNVYFEFDKAVLKPESYVELNNLLCWLETRKDIIIEISGHTDFIGSDQYNLRLSGRRANAVVKYLINGGVQNARLSAKGYGESKPLASNDDEKEGRELNRRTEFKIVKISPL